MSQSCPTRALERQTVGLHGSSQSQSASVAHGGGAEEELADADTLTLGCGGALEGEDGDADAAPAPIDAEARGPDEVGASFCWLPHARAARLSAMPTAKNVLMAMVYHTALAALAACGSASTGSTVVDVAAPSASASMTPIEKPSGDALIVWRPEEDHDRAPSGIVSVLVDGAGATLVERPEPIVVIDGAPFAFRARTVATTFCDCNACLGPTGCPDPMPGVPGSVGVPVLVPLGAASNVPEAYAFADVTPETTCTTGEAEESFDMHPHALVGPYLFGTVSAMYMGCLAAHPMWDSQIVAMDLRTRAGLVTSPPDGRLTSMIATADDQLKDECVMDETEEPVFWRGSAKLDEMGKIVGQYTFTKSAPYMCGTGPGHYSVATEIEDPEKPAFVLDASVPRGLEPALIRLHAIGFSAPIPKERVGDALKLLGAPLPADP